MWNQNRMFYTLLLLGNLDPSSVRWHWDRVTWHVPFTRCDFSFQWRRTKLRGHCWLMCVVLLCGLVSYFAVPIRRHGSSHATSDSYIFGSIVYSVLTSYLWWSVRVCEFFRHFKFFCFISFVRFFVGFFCNL